MQAFDCKMCGQCCEGRGGIVLAEKDVRRLLAFLQITRSQLYAEYIEFIADKPRIKAGDDGFCRFFEHGIGCKVHPAKPDVCRAWPFFQGNLKDPVSFQLAKEYCPGIAEKVSFEIFRKEGLEYMDNEGLFADDLAEKPNALKKPAS